MFNFQINKVYATYSWKWNVKDEICGICQQAFEQMCPKCTHPIECTPCVGVCEHAYHVHCLQDWVSKKKFCPLCRVPWEYKKVFSK